MSVISLGLLAKKKGSKIPWMGYLSKEKESWHTRNLFCKLINYIYGHILPYMFLFYPFYSYQHVLLKMPQLCRIKGSCELTLFQNVYLERATEEISCWPQVAAFRGAVPQCYFKTPQATFEYNPCLKNPTSNLIVSAVNSHQSLCFFYGHELYSK